MVIVIKRILKLALCEDIYVAVARKELEYIIKATYSNLVYSPYEPLYSFNTLVLLLNSIFVKTCYNALVLISLQKSSVN